MPATATAEVPKQTNAGVSTSELIDRIIAFCQALSGRVLYKYQLQFARRLIRSVLDNDGEEITALFARQSGKSQTVADVSAGLCVLLPILANMPMFCNDIRLKGFSGGFWVGIFAPTLRQSQNTYNKIRGVLLGRHAKAILPDLGITFTSNNGITVSLSNGSFVTSSSASEGTNIEGDSYMLLILEECQDISDHKIRKSIHPMGAAYNASIIKIGTCTTYRGDFYEAIQRNIKSYEVGRRGKNHYQYDYLVVMKYNSKYAKYIQKEIYRLGEDSDEFKLSYKLIWILERSMFVTTDYMTHNIYNTSLDVVDGDRSSRHVAGIDFGKSNDSTVITIGEPDWDNPIIIEKANLLENRDVISDKDEAYVAYRVVLKAWLELMGDDYETQYPQMMAFLNKFRLEKVVADATGVGSPIVDRLAANLPCEVVPYVYNTPSKSALYKHFNAELRGKRLVVPACDALQETLIWRHFDRQMCELQKGYTGSYMVCQHPKAKDAHDDFPDSCSLMLWAARKPGLHKVECTEGNPLYMKACSISNFYKARNSHTARRR